MAQNPHLGCGLPYLFILWSLARAQFIFQGPAVSGFFIVSFCMLFSYRLVCSASWLVVDHCKSISSMPGLLYSTECVQLTNFTPIFDREQIFGFILQYLTYCFL